jgi:1-deoxy-D-xylulose-5-phosphate synthase
LHNSCSNNYYFLVLRWIESEHDIFGAGHASTSISAALGILEGKKQRGDKSHAVAIIGDGALTGGLSFEGLNHAGDLKRNLIVILNDNKISIDPNVGALKDTFNASPSQNQNYFQHLGFDYWGPLDGHNISELITTFENAKKLDRPLLIHLHTEKGRSYAPAVKDKVRFHGCGPFDLETGVAMQSPEAKPKYQDIFAETLIEFAEHDPKVLAITAAMPSGTSLKKFQKVYPERCFDVGIAEGHAALFGAGLATQKAKPFVCVYSTFLQRAYDQLIHDIALQNLPVRVCMDRSGLVRDDGATHQGVFDYAYLRCIPNFVVMASKDEAEMQRMLETMRLYNAGPISLRFPRGEVRGVGLSKELLPIPIGTAEHLYGETQGDVLLLAIGEPVYDAVVAAKNLEEHHSIQASVVNLRFVKPLDEKMILNLAPHFKSIMTIEEGSIHGGVGSAVLELLANHFILCFSR